MMKNRQSFAFSFLITFWLIACGSGDTETPAAAQSASAPNEAAAVQSDPAAADEATPAPAAQDEAAEETTAAEGEEPDLDESDLTHGGSIEIKEYSVAFIGSASLGKGTLRVGGAAHPFRIGGLGLGGIGIASIDARGNVYNLHDLGDFPGAFGKARVGATAADKGKGKLWLKNTKGVVIELWSEMEGLALTLGVDGIVVQWEADYQSGLQDVQDGTQKAWDDTKTGTRKAIDAMKKPFE
ncbi:MAG: hypothetical protein JRG80_08410 [Deltaproteobacteria bacterium]|nr:hypothetical protein [Deltaproteobacteria bacterium]MBW2399282.1 hypothetical protein [Deltaproteobacteria bacterium]